MILNAVSSMFRWNLIIVLIVMSLTKVSGQSEQQMSYVVLRADFGQDSLVKLRWAPTSYAFWQEGIENGYWLERMTLGTQDSTWVMDSVFTSRIVLDTLILTRDTSEWLIMVDSLEDPNFELAFGAMFADSLIISLGDSMSVMSAMQAQSELENRYNMALLAAEISYPAATLSGLAYIDTTAEYGYSYLYRIHIHSIDTLSSLYDGVAVIECWDSAVVKSTPIFQIGHGQGGLVTLGWIGDPQTWLNYQLQRSEDGSSFFDLNSLPVLSNPVNDKQPNNFIHFDTVQTLHATYIYRIRGKDAFGNLSDWSDTIHVVNLPLPLNIQPSIDSLPIHHNDSISIYWQFPSIENSKILGFEVWRSDKAHGDYDLISGTNYLPSSDRQFLDDDPNEINYYKIRVIDTFNYSKDSWSSMAQLSDSIPPVKPSTPVGTAYGDGQVVISWTPNPDMDLAGYRVFSSNLDTAEYTQLTLNIISDTSFIHTIDLETLQKETFIRIKAIDRRGNISEFSEPATISLPDIVPPAPPVIVNGAAKSGINGIQWIPSSSTDVIHYLVKRKELGFPNWSVIGQLSPQANQMAYSDTIENSVNAYQYVVIAVDGDENEGASQVVTLQGPMPSRDTVEMIDIQKLADNTGIVFSWDYSVTKGLVGFRIYRAIDGHPFVQYAVYNLVEAQGGYDAVTSVDGDYYMVDKKVKHTRQYKYKVTALFEDGTSSPMSSELIIVFNL